jgi:sugar lactone lactonase YvrE
MRVQKIYMKAAVLIDCACELGEGPMWHPAEKVLYWVDILKKTLHRFNPATGDHQFFEFTVMPGAVVPSRKNNHLIISFEDGIAAFNWQTRQTNYLVSYHQNRSDLRANDGKCDALGNFWTGTMSKTALSAAGNLYCLTSNLDLQIKIAGTTISNGLAWSANGTQLYYIDSARHSIRRFDIDYTTGQLSNQQTIIHRPEYAWFDGMTIDTEGMLWVAHCNEACIKRWNPVTGQVITTIALPCPNVTSICFGEEAYDTLFITTAREHMTPAEIARYPLSGAVFYVTTDCRGLPTNSFNYE